MTGRDLIIYILQNDLEDAEVIKNGVLKIQAFGFMTAAEAAAKFGVGVATITMWHSTGVLKGVNDTHGNLYIFKDAKDPRCM